MNANEQEFVEIIPEPLVEPDFEVFETPSEKVYRLWKTRGGDVAFMLVEVLRGSRRHEISLCEIGTTQLYRRSSPAERYALVYVCSESSDVPLSENDAEKLKLNDQRLMDLVDGKLLGHGDFKKTVALIPTRLAERRHFDDRTFSYAAKYESPKLFGWIFGK